MAVVVQFFNSVTQISAIPSVSVATNPEFSLHSYVNIGVRLHWGWNEELAHPPSQKCFANHRRMGRNRGRGRVRICPESAISKPEWRGREAAFGPQI